MATWDPYDLLESIGRTARVETFHAVRPPSTTPLLVHRGLTPADADPYLAAGLDEAQVFARLDHPSLASVLVADVFDGVARVVTPHVPGVSLRTILDRREPMPWPSAARLGAAIADLLVSLHALPWGFVLSHHGAFAPADFLVDGDTVRLTNLGVAFLVRDRDPFAPVSPEAVRALPLTSAADAFALGWLLWELVTGARLFDAPGEFARFDLVRSTPAPRLTHVPPAFATLVAALLDRDPARRPTSARTHAELLRGL